MIEQPKEWFDEWFDSPYYHILYRDRDYTEAQNFIDKIAEYFQFASEDQILDLACGKGRHSIYLNEKGYRVIGVDLSQQNIAHASQYSNERLQFYIHDMRKVFKGNTFDYVLNMFTSFGYFDKHDENQSAITAIAKGLKSEGYLLLDFLNPYKVINNLVADQVKEIGGVEFHITKYLSDDKYIVKDIRFEDQGESYYYQERVKAIRRLEFLDFFKTAKMEVIKIFGDYQLNPYDCETSDRMIFIAKKTKED